MQALRTLGDIQLDALLRIERTVAGRLDCEVVDEHVLAAAIHRDEAEPFSALNHFTLPLRSGKP